MIAGECGGGLDAGFDASLAQGGQDALEGFLGRGERGVDVSRVPGDAAGDHGDTADDHPREPQAFEPVPERPERGNEVGRRVLAHPRRARSRAHVARTLASSAARVGSTGAPPGALRAASIMDSAMRMDHAGSGPCRRRSSRSAASTASKPAIQRLTFSRSTGRV